MPHPSGEKHYAAKLTAKAVIEMRSLHNTPCECCGQRLTVRALARKFGVSKATAGHALTGRNWGDPLSFASAMSGRSPETEGLSPKDASATAEGGDAQNTPDPTPLSGKD